MKLKFAEETAYLSFISSPVPKQSASPRRYALCTLPPMFLLSLAATGYLMRESLATTGSNEKEEALSGLKLNAPGMVILYPPSLISLKAPPPISG